MLNFQPLHLSSPLCLEPFVTFFHLMWTKKYRLFVEDKENHWLNKFHNKIETKLNIFTVWKDTF